MPLKDPPQDSAGVTIAPPALYFWTLVVSGLISVVWPWPLPIPGLSPILVMHLGVILMLGSFILFTTAVSTFKRHDTPLAPWTSTRTLVDVGPYRFSRNPIYGAFSVFLLGFAALIDSSWTLMALVPVLWIMRSQVIAKEEFYLSAKFGPTYDSYKQRVRRWL